MAIPPVEEAVNGERGRLYVLFRPEALYAKLIPKDIVLCEALPYH